MKNTYYIHNSFDIDLALIDLKGYWKFWSFILLHKVNLPALNGAIFTSNYNNIHSDIASLFRMLESDQLLFRHDKKPEKPPYPRGGFFVSAETWEHVLAEYFHANRIVALLEPFNSLCNSHNFNIFFHDYSSVIVEVIGPGFDASDLQRGDISPHEVYKLDIENFGKKITGSMLHIADNDQYTQSVLARRDKIANRLTTSNDKVFTRYCELFLDRDDALDKYLIEVGSILPKALIYNKIGLTYIIGLIRQLLKSGVIEEFYNGTDILFPLNFSASIVNPGNRLIFWDIVSPNLKYYIYRNRK